MKLLVYGVYLLEMTQTVEISRSMFHLFVNQFLDKNALDDISDLWFSVPIIGAIGKCMS